MENKLCKLNCIRKKKPKKNRNNEKRELLV